MNIKAPVRSHHIPYPTTWKEDDQTRVLLDAEGTPIGEALGKERAAFIVDAINEKLAKEAGVKPV